MTQRKGGDSCDSSDLQRHLQDLELKGIFSIGLGKVIDECRSKNLRTPSNCIPVLHVAFHSTKQIIEQEKGQSAEWAGECRWNGASFYFAVWSQKQETPLGSQEFSHQGRTVRLEKDILEMLWCLTYFIRQPFVDHWSIYKHEL